MATTQRELLAKQLLQAQATVSDGRQHHASKPASSKPKRPVRGSGRSTRHHRISHRLPSPTEQQLERREQGWNDRFTRDNTPTQPKRPTRVHRAIDDANDTHTQKERKMREERQQYGSGDPFKCQRPGVGRLVPIVPLALPPREPEMTSSKGEKLRFNVLKAIDSRETLIYQLNALILCTPVQEAIVKAASRVASGGHPHMKPRATMAIAPSLASVANKGSAMSNSREAMRLAQQLGADLQVSGIQVVEGIVEWMLEAGAKADKPPEFVWRGRNYFAKMMNDLDFAGPELHARGVELECFAVANPLCIRPDQKLGRVLAAQSIIRDMAGVVSVEVAPQEKADSSSGRDRQISRGRMVRSRGTTPKQHVEEHSPMEEVFSAGDTKPQFQSGTNEMILASKVADEYEDDAFTSARSAGSEIPVPQIAVTSIDVLHDSETQKELVDILDESFCEAPEPGAEAQIDSPFQVSGGSGKNSARDEYENSFVGDDGEELPSHERYDTQAESGDEAAEQVPRTNDLKRDISDDLSPRNPDTQFSSGDTTDTATNAFQNATANVVDAEATGWDHRAALLSLHAPALGAISGVLLKEWCTWASSRRQQLHAAVSTESWSEVQLALEGSLLRGLSAAWSDKETRQATLTSFMAECKVFDITLTERLWEECQVVVDAVCGGLACVFQRDLTQISPFVSEVDLTDIVEAAEKLLGRDDICDSVVWVSQATEVLIALHPMQQYLPSASLGFSALLRIFYPYLVSQRRDKLVQSWHQMSRLLLDKCSIRLGELAFLLDTPCKILLLNVTRLRRVNSEENESDSVAIPKLSIVCDRGNLLQSSIEEVLKKCLTISDDSEQLPSYQIFPFFQSSYGEKEVNGVRVEEGEGKGPLKEWFALIATDLTAKWAKVELPVGASDDFDPVLANGNKLVVDRVHEWLKPGHKIEWRFTSEEALVSRIINTCDPSNGTYLLDRGGIGNQSFNISELRVFQPRIPYLEYIQASESYWLNEAVGDTPANHQTLAFIGWFLANALVHQCALQRRLHPLLFDLLLDAQRTVTLQDLKALDPTLHTALEQLQRMNPAEFASYVEFEGFSPLTSVEEYTTRTIDDKYGAASSIAWQLQELRRGFHRVFSPHDLCSCNISAVDLADHFCGDTHEGSTTQDFDLQEAFRVSLDPDFASCEPLRRGFWKAVGGYEPSLKRKLVKFITGVETLPHAGTEFLLIEMPFPALSPIECERTLRMLPQSHTCDNTLELPHYWRALCWKNKHDPDRPSEQLETDLVALLSEKLRLAAEYSSGYGLDGTKSAGGSLAGILLGSVADNATEDTGGEQLDVQDSYESLNLPGLTCGESIDEEAGESKTVVPPPPHADDRGSLETTDLGWSSNHQNELTEQLQAVGDGEKLTGFKKDVLEDEEYGAEDWDAEDDEEVE